MREQTFYISDDHRKFSTAEQCLEWERVLSPIRKARQRIWDRYASYLKDVKGYGPSYVTKKIGEHCADDFVFPERELTWEAGLDAEVVRIFGDMGQINPQEPMEYTASLRAKCLIVFGSDHEAFDGYAAVDKDILGDD